MNKLFMWGTVEDKLGKILWMGPKIFIEEYEIFQLKDIEKHDKICIGKNKLDEKAFINISVEM